MQSTRRNNWYGDFEKNDMESGAICSCMLKLQLGGRCQQTLSYEMM